MKVYVAGKWEEKVRVQEIMQLLRDSGHTISVDWTKHKGTDDPAVLAKEASEDLWGVVDADAFVGVFEKDLKYQGAIAEFGMAALRGIPCFIIGDAIDACIFTHLPNVTKDLVNLFGYDPFEQNTTFEGESN